MFALGNEIPPGIVRWHGHARVERFLRNLYDRPRTSRRSALHLRQLSADRISRPVVLRRLRVQRLPASRTRAARVSRAPAAHRRAQAAAAGGGRRGQHSRRGRRTGGDHVDAHPRGVHRRRVRRGGIRLDRRVVARRIRRRRLGVRPGRSPADTEAGRGSGRRAPLPTRRSHANSRKRGPGYRWSSVPTTLPTRSRTACRRSSG